MALQLLIGDDKAEVPRRCRHCKLTCGLMMSSLFNLGSPASGG